MQFAKNCSYESHNNANISYFADSFVTKTEIYDLIRASLITNQELFPVAHKNAVRHSLNLE